MNRSEKIALDQVKKLIPINGELINFAADVQIGAATDKPFLMAVVSQEMLDNSTELPYKSIEKQVSFSVRNDNNIYNPYVIVLKSDFPQEAIITINLQETPLVSGSGCGKQTTIYPPALASRSASILGAGGNGSMSDMSWYKNWKYWAFIIICIIIVYYFLKKKDEPILVEMSRFSDYHTANS